MNSARTMRCPCLSGDVYESCCGPVIAGRSAPSAERLMRSRYTAFAHRDTAYLLKSWHASTRPETLDLDDSLEWRALEIVSVVQGGPFDSAGTVEFRAHFRDDGVRGVLHERSTFVKENTHWFYVDGVISD
ncbi:YchJ family protein [Microbacterium sp. YY-01]|uniref:YchJ family protein n=1 Tax=Microbacterium sp. YY-01 TaxID=3421634 RepID=UPI003D169D17